MAAVDKMGAVLWSCQLPTSRIFSVTRKARQERTTVFSAAWNAVAALLNMAAIAHHHVKLELP